jgi:hypothetical protein
MYDIFDSIWHPTSIVYVKTELLDFQFGGVFSV